LKEPNSPQLRYFNYTQTHHYFEYLLV
jgi:hypothetical protein